MNKTYSPGLEVDRGNQDKFPTVCNAAHQQRVADVQLQYTGSALKQTASDTHG